MEGLSSLSLTPAGFARHHTLANVESDISWYQAKRSLPADSNDLRLGILHFHRINFESLVRGAFITYGDLAKSCSAGAASAVRARAPSATPAGT